MRLVACPLLGQNQAEPTRFQWADGVKAETILVLDSRFYEEDEYTPRIALICRRFDPKPSQSDNVNIEYTKGTDVFTLEMPPYAIVSSIFST